MDDQKLRRIIGVIVCLAVLRGLIYSLLIPFDHAPDEYHHFKLIKAKHLQLNHSSEEEQQHVAASVRLTWCYLVNPETCPQKTSLEDFRGSRSYSPSPPSSLQLYYLVTAWILKIFSFENVKNEIYVIRGFSILCGTVVVFLSFLIAKEIFPDHVFLLIGVLTFITFIPQFSAMNGVITNDKLAEVFTALLFWLMVKICKHGMKGAYLSAYIITLGLALLGKRTAAFMVPVSLVFLLVYYWKSSIGIRMHIVLISMFLGIAIGGYCLVWNATVYNFIEEYVISLPGVEHIQDIFLRPDLYSLESLKYYAKFFIVMYWSFWGIFGYMTIHLHHFWYMLAALGQFLALLGVFRFVVHTKMKKNACEKWKSKILYLFAISIFFVVLVPFLRTVIFRRIDSSILTQGRYLFPVIIPISILTIFGLAELFPQRYYHLVGAMGIIGLLILDMVCLSNYILLNFHFISFF